MSLKPSIRQTAKLETVRMKAYHAIYLLRVACQTVDAVLVGESSDERFGKDPGSQLVILRSFSDILKRTVLKQLTKPYLSSLTALSARVYSTALSNGCRAGSRFLWTLRRSWERSLVHSVSLRLIALTLTMQLERYGRMAEASAGLRASAQTLRSGAQPTGCGLLGGGGLIADRDSSRL